MKIKAAIVIAALLLSITSPLSIHISASDGGPVLVSLDVCNTAGAALSVNPDAAVIQECSFRLVIPAVSGYVNPSNPDYLSLTLASKQERPPEA